MPEIWLQYGTSSIVLDIKFENLAMHAVPDLKALSEQEIESSLANLKLTEDTLIIALSSSKASARIISTLVKSLRASGFANYSIDVPSTIATGLRSNLTAIAQEDEQIAINRLEHGIALSDRIKKFQTAITISQTAVDPLFGFSGAPTAILRNFATEKMSEAFSARAGDMPNPGVHGEPLKIAREFGEALGVSQSIEIVPGGEGQGIAGVHIGTLSEAFESSVAQLVSSAVLETPQSKCVIASAGRDLEVHSTLNSSLNSLWNCLPNLKEGGSVILAAENRNGIGGGALQMYVESRFKQEQFLTGGYIQGLEHLLFINSLKDKYDLGVLSSLPRYYLKSQLGFTAYSGMKEALERLLQKHGRSTKCLVISEGDMNLRKPA